LFNTELNIVTDIKQAHYSLVDHGNGLIMLHAHMDHLRHGIVEDGDLEDVAPEHLESHEVTDLDLMFDGKSRSALIVAESAFDVP
jgi:hypothetical protein